ncbi:hypothetical protein QAD02_003513 [Eretmocerus hayati]|uniref:Uncharacterized protein n=1 Tax=Eretmocerus hayati TaxID=131215 RepID=A0ACC2NMG3_9HYME|nr:hypothetical protein QAD02_003513 [Eretmocerus hayati]
MADELIRDAGSRIPRRGCGLEQIEQFQNLLANDGTALVVYNLEGSCIGGFLGGVCRKVLPLLKRGTKKVGKEAVRAGYNVVSDIAHGELPLRNSIETRLRVSGNVLKRRAEEHLRQLFDEPRMGEPNVLQLLPDSREDCHTLSSGGGVHFLNQGSKILRESHAKGYCLFAIDLTPDLSANTSTH